MTERAGEVRLVADTELGALAERVAALEAEVSQARGERVNLARRLRRARVVVAGLGVALALAAPLAALAATQSFADVPPTNSFFTVIERVKAAGIASGCGGGNYCPSDAVTREQMAAFLNRSAGRLERVPLNVGLGSGGTVTTSLAVRASDVSGGTMQVLLIGEVMMSLPSTTGCPCVIEYGLYQGDTFIPGSTRYQARDALVASNLTTSTVTVTAAVSIPTAVTTTFRLKGAYIAGTQPLAATLTGSFSALVIPFTGDGSASGG